MNKFLTGLGWLLAVAGIALWLSGQASVTSLSNAKLQLETEIDLLEKTNEGLEAANNALRNRQRPLDLPDRPTKTIEVIKTVEVPAKSNRGNDQGSSETEEVALTPEQLAEKQQQEEEREARRQEWQQKREEFRARMVQGAQDRRSFFSQVSTEGLAPEFAESHDRLLGALGEAEVYMAQMGNQDLEPEQRREMHKEMHGLMNEINDLMDVERQILLSDVATSYGLDDQESAEFMDTLEYITEMTTPPRFGGGRGGRGGGGGGR